MKGPWTAILKQRQHEAAGVKGPVHVVNLLHSSDADLDIAVVLKKF